MAATHTSEQVPLKLLINNETNSVIFAEAGKDFVDVLFSFLTFPIGTIARLVRKESDMKPVRVGCISSLYESVESLDKECPYKELLVRPRNSSNHYCKRLKLNIDDTEPNLFNSPFAYYDCPKIYDNICKGFVKASETFIITNDLIFMPTSLDTAIDMLLNCGIKTISSVQKVTVNVTKEKVLDLLKFFLLSKSTLTDLFLEKKPFLEWSCFSACGVANNSSMSIKTEVKLVMRESDGRVLFAQGEQEFVEFILSFLILPLGKAACMLGGNSSLGCVVGMYKSIVDLDENKYFMSEEMKNRLVNAEVAPLFLSRSPSYVPGTTIFNITDELLVVPVSQNSTVSLPINLKTPLNDLKEKIVTIGVKEGLSILKASLTSKSALTNGLSHLLNETELEK
ncbi:hypothetical protein VNO78_15772 [Psophocarpus tetragonolobus]|uniref:DUF674 family protein n=1 Tax=Psophocarpus tetragonolobus TaxID=3891 RepID=A0AAN9SGN0_PSOTE